MGKSRIFLRSLAKFCSIHALCFNSFPPPSATANPFASPLKKSLHDWTLRSPFRRPVFIWKSFFVKFLTRQRRSALPRSTSSGKSSKNTSYLQYLENKTCFKETVNSQTVELPLSEIGGSHVSFSKVNFSLSDTPNLTFLGDLCPSHKSNIATKYSSKTDFWWLEYMAYSHEPL